MKQLDEALEKMNMDASSAAASATGTSHPPSTSQRGAPIACMSPSSQRLQAFSNQGTSAVSHKPLALAINT
ncbi:hypothetical protein ACET3Z_032885 [Daucus carota]